MCAAGALRGWPASITTTERRRHRVRAADVSATVAAPPPTTMTSVFIFMAQTVVRPSKFRGSQVAIFARRRQSRFMADPPANPLTDLQDVVRSRLRALRIANGWSLDELGERTHLGVSTLSRIETGHRTIGLDVLLSLARVLGMPISTCSRRRRDDDVVIRPRPPRGPGPTLLAAHPPARVPRRRPSRCGWNRRPCTGPARTRATTGCSCWSGAVGLTLGERTIITVRRRSRRVLDDDPALDRGPRANDRAHHDLRSHWSRRGRAGPHDH